MLFRSCWALRNRVQDLIDAKEIQFEAPERPNIVTAPMPQHGVNAIEEDLYAVLWMMLLPLY